MILRKPIAILIKNFKLIHGILAILMFYLILKSNDVLSFITEYLTSNTTTIKHDVLLNLFNPYMIVSVILIILGTIIIFGLLLFKKKPVIVYIVNIAIYIYVIAIYSASYSTIKSLEVGLLSVQSIKLIQDLVTTSLVLQAVSLVVTVIRTTGFDIKKFNFVKDLEELEIEVEDSEEFEVNIDLDTDKIRRNIRKKWRHFKYVYIENKFIFHILSALFIALICTVIFLNFGVYNKIYKQNNAFTTTNLIMSATKSYVTSYDYSINEIEEDKKIVVVELKIRTLGSKEQVLTTGRISLQINNHLFYHQKNLSSKFSDLGFTYKGETLSNEFSTYLLLFEIPNSFSEDKMILTYSDFNNKKIKIKITPTNLDINTNTTSFSLGENIELSDSILEDSTLKIDSFEIADYFKYEFNYCLNNIECYPSYKYIKPELTSNFEKSILKINGVFNLDENLKINSLTNLYEFINMFAKITYKINEQEKVMTIPWNQIKKDSDIYYIEVLKEIESATNINLTFQIRNNIYKIVLK
ncbi:MAG: hypothetical protein ACK5HP_04950 [Bacilli bacterium]